MSFDQQGLVGCLVMLKDSDFAGVVHSLFVWSIALIKTYVEHTEGSTSP